MFFSIIVPVYNVEKYLPTCIESVLCQTHKDFELILINDGSTDQSGALCDGYAQKDGRVKVIHKPNGGQSTARNAGLRNATGEYACFLDSDDFYDTERFLEEVDKVASSGTDMVLFRYCKYYEDDRTDTCGISMAGLDGKDKAELLSALVSRDAFFCSCWSKAIRMDVLKGNGIVFDETLSCEDMDWFYTVLLHTQTIRVIDKPYVNYRQRENSVTASFKPKAAADYVKTLKKWNSVFAKMEDAEEKKVMISSLAKLYCNLLISYARHTKALKEFKKDIFSFRYLLAYDMNPRTKVIKRFADPLGVGVTCWLLRIFDKVR